MKQDKSVVKSNRYWWIMLIMGILSILFGIWVFRNPIASYIGLSLYFCVMFIILGISEIAHAFSSQRSDSWGWGLTLGIIDLVIGIMLLSDLQWAEAVLPYAVGFILMFKGIDFIGLSTQMRHLKMANWGWILSGGILTLLFSFLIVFHPIFGIFNIIVWTGLAFIMGGISAVFLAFASK